MFVNCSSFAKNYKLSRFLINKMLIKTLMVCTVLWIVIPISSAQCERKLIIHTIRYGECQPKRLLAYGCRGTCSSYTRPSATESGELEHFCQCCQDAHKRFARVPIKCPDPSGPRPFKIYLVRLAVPIECSCRPCSLLPNTIIPSEPDFLQGKRNHLIVKDINDKNSTSKVITTKKAKLNKIVTS